MENKQKKVPGNTITRDVKNIAAPTGNIYESVVVLYKRANQIALAEKIRPAALRRYLVHCSAGLRVYRRG